MSSPRVTFNLTYGKGVTELQNLTSLCLSSFAESYQMQQNNVDVSPYSALMLPEVSATPPYLAIVLTPPDSIISLWQKQQSESVPK